MAKHWVSCEKFTCAVYTDGMGVVRWTAPYLRKFIGQPWRNVIRWADAKGWKPKVVDLDTLKEISE